MTVTFDFSPTHDFFDHKSCERDPEEMKHGEQLYQNAGGDDGRYVFDSKAGWIFGEPQDDQESRPAMSSGNSQNTVFVASMPLSLLNALFAGFAFSFRAAAISVITV